MVAMNRKGKKLSTLILLITGSVAACIGLLTAYLLRPDNSIPIGARVMIALGDISFLQYGRLGLYPPTTAEYFASTMGARAVVLRAGVPTWSGLARDFRLATRRRGGNLIISGSGLITSWTWKPWFRRREPYQIEREIAWEPVQQTRSLLQWATNGSRAWRRLVPRGGGPDPHFFPESTPVTVPLISFNLPRTHAELEEYWRWLVRVTGSANRFRDGWGHQIRLTLDNISHPLLLIGSSAGPDGKLNTQDDMIVKRSIRTGKVVEEIGMSN